MSRYEARIGEMLVMARHPYIVYGRVRGLVAQHQTLEAARQALAHDKQGCKAQGGYSDADVYYYANDQWNLAELEAE